MPNSERSINPSRGEIWHIAFWSAPPALGHEQANPRPALVVSVDTINSETNKAGEQFIAVLDEAVFQGGIEVIPRGADVRGRIANINEAGRISGSAQLGLELTQIVGVEKHVKLNIRELIALVSGKGAIHERGKNPRVLHAQVADGCNHRFLRNHKLPFSSLFVVLLTAIFLNT